MKVKSELLDELVQQAQAHGQELLGPDGLIAQLTGQLVKRMLDAELTEHLGYDKGQRATGGNRRNGGTRKTVQTDTGALDVEIPRDRDGSFEPRFIKKHQRRLVGFDDKVLSLYARGMTVREIQQHLEELYHTEVSPALISRATETVMEDVRAWQNRPLAPVWPIIYVDALVVKMRDEGVVQNRAVYIAIGVNMDGKKEVLGLWVDGAEGAKFWMKVMTELRNRGMQDVIIACCDGLKGFPDAIETVFPQATVQTCIVHLIRSSLRYVSYKDRKEVATALKPIYSAATVEAAGDALRAFETAWSSRYPMIGAAWRQQWERLTPFLAFPSEIRKVIYTTNAIESLNAQLRKLTRHRGHFPSEEAALKLLYLALTNAEKRWSMPIRDWQRALHQMSVYFAGRLPVG